MQQATKTTLVGLARSLDANKAVFCLNSLAREEVDTDFDEVLGELIHGLSSLRSVDIQSSGDVLDAGLRELIKSAGLERYAQAIARQTDLAAPHVSLLVGPARALWGADSPVTALFEIAKLPELENNTIAWLASHAASDTNVRTDLILPLLERYGHDLSGGETLANAANAFLAHPEGMETLRTILHQGSGGHVAGVLILLGQAGDPQDIALVGPFIEDFGAWERFSRALLTSQRLATILERTRQSDLARVVDRTAAANANDQDRASILATDAEFHRAVARLISGISPLTLASSLADSQVAAALKGFVSDVDAPIRVAAARSLSRFKHDAAVSFLRTGLLDRNKEVRAVCQTALEQQVGGERYEALLQELGEESTSLREKVKGLSDWARGALTEVEGALTSMAGTVQARTVALATWTRDLLGWTRTDS